MSYESYESSDTNTANTNTISNVLNIKNKYLNSSIFLSNDVTEQVESDNINTNVTFYGNSAGNNAIDLQNLKENIEKMSKFHQIEILRILSSSNNVCLNENNNGTFVNLTEQPKDIINELKKYVKYVNDQQMQLSIIEDERDRLRKTVLNKCVKYNKEN
jgi:hypothetical protein